MTCGPFALHRGDALQVMWDLEPESFDAMLCDPPYGLSFMGKEWDHGVPSAEVWEAALAALKPGAFALVFGGTRTFHRLAVALEDAGFEVRDCMMWLTAQGFPKSHNVGKATGLSKWEGFGSALKPAYEPILLVRKPTPSTFAQTALEQGCGALNINGGRIGWASDADREAGRPASFAKAHNGFDGQAFKIADRSHRSPAAEQSPSGRWPANVLLDEEAARQLDEATGDRRSAYPNNPKAAAAYAGSEVPMNGVTYPIGKTAGLSYSDSGGPSRFFYTAKASKRDRNKYLTTRTSTHPTVKPLALTRYLATLLLPPERDTPRRILTPFAGSGSEMLGALEAGWDHATGIELEAEYHAIALERLRNATAQPSLLEATA